MIRDNEADRELGAYWERRFIQWCIESGLDAETIAQRRGAPDVLVESREAHEVKHKTPTRPKYLRKEGEPYPRRYIGLEQYRVDLFQEYEGRTGRRVFYTVHDWSFADGGYRDSKVDLLDAWRTAPLDDLLTEAVEAEIEETYHRGELNDDPVDGLFFPWNAFRPLREYLTERVVVNDR